jgi:anaerobic ribonucleoside-triphosphate reductase activating protein
MPDLTLLFDQVTGRVLLEEPDRLSRDLLADLEALLGHAAELGCARPVEVLPPPSVLADGSPDGPWVRVAGYYHHSLVEGPGRRSSVLLAGCDLACPGCWVPNLHPSGAGSLVPVDVMAAALLDPAHERNGVSILGGEPFLHPEGLLALIRALRRRGCPHIVCYSGYAYEVLRRRSARQPEIAQVLDEIEVLIDGPFVAALADQAGPWTGSGNQRVVDLVATRRSGRVVCLDDGYPFARPRQATPSLEEHHGAEGEAAAVPDLQAAPAVDVHGLPTGHLQAMLPPARVGRQAGGPARAG